MNIWVGMRILWTSIPSGTSPEDKYCKEEDESKDGPWNQSLIKVIETKAVYYDKFGWFKLFKGRQHRLGQVHSHKWQGV